MCVFKTHSGQNYSSNHHQKEKKEVGKQQRRVWNEGDGLQGAEVKGSKGGKKSRAKPQRSTMESKPKEIKSEEGFEGGEWGSWISGEESDTKLRAVWLDTDVKHK